MDLAHRYRSEPDLIAYRIAYCCWLIPFWQWKSGYWYPYCQPSLPCYLLYCYFASSFYLIFLTFVCWLCIYLWCWYSYVGSVTVVLFQTTKTCQNHCFGTYITHEKGRLNWWDFYHAKENGRTSHGQKHSSSLPLGGSTSSNNKPANATSDNAIEVK